MEIRLPDFLLPPTPDDLEWAWEVMKDLRVRWREPHPGALQILVEDLAARRATARRHGLAAAGLVVWARLDPADRLVVPRPGWQIRSEQHLGSLAILVGLAVPEARIRDQDRCLDPSIWLRRPDALRWMLEADRVLDLWIPGWDGLEAIQPVARRVGMEIRLEEDLGQEAEEKVRAIRQDMARLAWLIWYLPPAESAARAEEAVRLAKHIKEQAWALRPLLGRLRSLRLLQAEVELTLLLADLGLLPGEENSRAAVVPYYFPSQVLEHIQDRKPEQGVVRLGLLRVWVRRDGQIQPLDRTAARIDPGLLEEEARHMEELARAYRARAAVLRGEISIISRPLRSQINE